MLRMRRLVSVLVVLAAGLLVLCAVAVIALDLGWQRERVRGLLEKMLAEQLEAEVTIGSLEGVFHSEVVARNVALIVEGERVAALDAVRIQLGNLRLWPSARLVVDVMEIDGAHLDLRRSASGEWNFARLATASPAEPAPPEQGEPTARVRIRSLEVRRGAFDLGLTPGPQGGRLAGTFALQIRGLALPSKALPDTSLELDLMPSELGGARLEVGRVRGRLSSQSWAIDEVALGGDGFDLRASGKGSLRRIDRLEMEGQVDELERLAELLPALEVSGRLEAQAEIWGDFANPEGTLRVSGERLALHGIQLGALDARVSGTRDGLLNLDALSLSGGRMPVAVVPGARLRLRPDGVVFEDLRLTAGGQSFAVGGGVDSEGFDALLLDATALDLEFFGALVGAPVELGGRADAHLELQGRFGSPSVTGSVEWQSPEIGTTRLDEMTLDFTTTKGALRIEAAFRDAGRNLLVADLRVPQAPLELSIWELAESPLLAIDLRAADFDLSLLGPLRSFGLPELRGVLDGRLRFVGGTPFPEQASLVLGAKRLSVGDAVPVDLEVGIADRGQGSLAVEQLRIVRGEDSLEALPGARLRFENRRIHFDGLELLAQEQRLRLTGAVGLQGFDGLRIEAQDLDVAALATLADATLDVAGRLDTKLELRGPFAEPALNGTVLWSQARVSGVPVDEVALDLQTIDGRIHAAGTVHREGRPVAEATAVLPPRPHAGEVPLLASGELEVELRADQLEFALLEPWLPRIFREPRGNAQGWLRLRGGQPRPRFEGALDLRDGSLSVPVLGRTLAPISGNLSLHSDSLRIETLRVGPPGKDAILSGTLGIGDAETRSAELHLALREFPLAQTGLAQANTSGTVTVAGPLDGLRVRGELLLSEVLIRLPEPQDPTLKEIRILADPGVPDSVEKSREPLAGVAGGADVDLGLKVPEGSRIRGQGADLEVAGELRLRKPHLEPVAYVGSLRAERGSYRLHGRRFVLRRGLATFDGLSAPDPLLDIEAAHRVQDVTVVALITGRASDPTVRLRSEPGLPERDVLAYLLFGRSADEVASSQQAALQSAAVGLAAGMVLTEVETVLGRDLPVESVDIRVKEDGSLGEVGVGGRLTERLSVRYGRTLGVNPEDHVGGEIRLAPNWSLQSDVTSSGKAGADVIWNFDY